MKTRLFLFAAILIAAVSSAAITSADGVTQRIRFSRGSTSATVGNSVVRGDRDTYILGARAGQTMTVAITSLEDNAVFQIENPHGEYLQGAGDGDDATSFSGTLPDKGDYKIIVGGTRGNATYKMTVTIK
jgi:hypothetical protein